MLSVKVGILDRSGVPRSVGILSSWYSALQLGLKCVSFRLLVC